MQIGSDQCKRADRFREVQIGSERFREVQIGSDRFRFVQACE